MTHARTRVRLSPPLPARPRSPRLIACSIAVAAAALTIAPTTFAQGATKPAPKPSASEAKKAAEAKAAEDQKKADEAKAAEDQKKADEAKAAEDQKKAADEASKPGMANASTVEPPAEVWDSSDVEELPGKTYLFIGARYRGNIIPQFMLNLFVAEGATIYSNTVGIELDKRKDGFSIIPALSFTEYGTGDILFKDKGGTDIPGNYTFVNSSMKAIYATVDLLWSTKISKNVDFEYGAGVGIGAVFGGLVNNWVYRDPNGPLQGETGNFSKCETEGQGGPGSGCNRADHQNSADAKVGNYTEKSWFDGGSKPVLFPWISLPQLGLRFKPVKQFEGRLGVGFSLTGFWFGLSGGYGLEQKPKS